MYICRNILELYQLIYIDIEGKILKDFRFFKDK